MTSPQRPSPGLATMLPGPRFQAADQVPAAPGHQLAPSSSPPPLRVDEQSLAEQREARRERRRMKQASPLEGRNVRHSGTGEPDGVLASPNRGQPQGTPPPIRAVSPEPTSDMARYGLAVDTEADVPSPTARAPRQRLSNPGRQSPEPRFAQTPTASDQGSELGSPSRRASRTDLHSSHDSLESFAQGAAFRANRRGSGFRKSHKGAAGGAVSKGAAQTAKAAGLGELHVVGEIVGASGFNAPMLFCRWELVYEPAKSWKVLRGLTKGSTHACCRSLGEEELVVWEHPLDIHMQTQSLQGWPSLLLRVHCRDEAYNRDCFVSYGLVKLPSTPGLHRLTCPTWFAVEMDRAAGRTFFGWFTGLTPRLEDESFITDLRQRDDAGAFMCTVGAGDVHLRVNILTRNFSAITHQGGESLAAALERLNTNIQKSVIMEERRRSHDSLTEGQRLVRSGREDRMTSARSALESRRRGGGDLPSPTPSDPSRNPSFLQGPPSFRGFGGGGGGGPRVSTSAGRLTETAAGGGQDADARSEVSYSSYSRPRDRYAERLARRERDQSAAAKEGSSATPSVVGGEASDGGAGGAAAAPSRPVSVSGTPASRTNSGIGERTGTRGGRGGGGGAAAAAAAQAAGAGRPADEDDDLETISAAEEGGGGGGAAAAETDLGSRAAARAARRGQQQRSAF